MSYDLFDFTESLSRVGIEPHAVASCTLGFGRSPEGYGSWEGGFVLHMKLGEPWAFVHGWCDTTGWGCQDGAKVNRFDHEPSREELAAAYKDEWGWSGSTDAFDFEPEDFDEMPADVNRFLNGELDRWGDPVASREEDADA